MGLRGPSTSRRMSRQTTTGCRRDVNWEELPCSRSPQQTLEIGIELPLELAELQAEGPPKITRAIRGIREEPEVGHQCLGATPPEQEVRRQKGQLVERQPRLARGQGHPLWKGDHL